MCKISFAGGEIFNGKFGWQLFANRFDFCAKSHEKRSKFALL